MVVARRLEPRTRHSSRRIAVLGLLLAVGAPGLVVSVPGVPAQGLQPLPRSAHVATSHPDAVQARQAAKPRRRLSVGISLGFGILDLPPARMRADLAKAKKLGAHRVRIDISWRRVEHTRGRHDWSDTDRVLRAARREGLSVLAVVGYRPDWARLPDGSADPAGFARFVRAAAKRYHSQVRVWELWNEPNLERAWSAPVSPYAYARLVAAAAPQLRRHDPQAKILVGALSPGVDVDDRSEMSPVTFLRRFYAAGVESGDDKAFRAAFDAVSIHPYTYPALPSGEQHWNTFHRLPAVHAVMRRAGDTGKKVWLTEYGAPTGTSSRAVSPKRQAAMVVSAYREARRLRFVQALFYYSLRDVSRQAHESEANFGLMLHHGRAKPGYHALRRELRKAA